MEWWLHNNRQSCEKHIESPSECYLLWICCFFLKFSLKCKCFFIHFSGLWLQNWIMIHFLWCIRYISTNLTQQLHNFFLSSLFFPIWCVVSCHIRFERKKKFHWQWKYASKDMPVWHQLIQLNSILSPRKKKQN